MKFALVLSIFGVIAAVNALSECVLNCQATAGQNECGTSNYNQTSCYCNNGEFLIDVQACLEKSCSGDLGDFHKYRGSKCTDSSSTSGTATATASSTTTASGAAATATITLSSCILACEATAAESVGGACSATNYNNTACFCQTDAFATQTQNCIFKDCADDDGNFHQLRGAICLADGETTNANAGQNSTDISSSSTSTTSVATTSTVSSTASSTATDNADNSNSSGLSRGAVAGISVGCIVGGLSIIGFAVFMFIRRRRRNTFSVENTTGSEAYVLHKLRTNSTRASQVI